MNNNIKKQAPAEISQTVEHTDHVANHPQEDALASLLVRIILRNISNDAKL